MSSKAHDDPQAVAAAEWSRVWRDLVHCHLSGDLVVPPGHVPDQEQTVVAHVRRPQPLLTQPPVPVDVLSGVLRVGCRRPVDLQR